MLKLRQASLEEISGVRKEIFGERTFDRDADSVHILATDCEKSVGCASMEKREDCFYVYGLGVKEDCRGRMTGQALLKMAEFLALNRGFDAIRCESDDGFIRKQGYEKVEGKYLEKRLSGSCCCGGHSENN